VDFLAIKKCVIQLLVAVVLNYSLLLVHSCYMTKKVR